MKPHHHAQLPPSVLDLAFVLVLMFMTTSMLAQVSEAEAMERSLPPIDLAKLDDDPNTKGLSGQSDAAEVITVAPGDIFYLGKEQISMEALIHKFKTQPPLIVEIRGDTQVPYGRIMEVMKLCRENGISQVEMTFDAS